MGVTATPSVLLDVRNLVVMRGGRALLREVSLDVTSGEVVAIIGPNGAGKSTLLSVMAGDIVPDRGTVTLGDRELHAWDVRELARVRAVLPQQTLLQFGFTGREVVAMGRSPLADVRRDADDDAIDAALRATEADPFAARRFPTLSGGEQTRVSLARVLAQETQLILLDEPTAALDIRHQQLVMQQARRLAGEGKSVVAILHDLNLAASHADRIAVMADGAIVRIDVPWQIADEALLSEVFDCALTVMPHPHHGGPLILPRG